MPGTADATVAATEEVRALVEARTEPFGDTRRRLARRHYRGRAGHRLSDVTG